MSAGLALSSRLEDEAGHTILEHFRGGRLLGPVWLLDPDNVGHLYTSLEDPQSSLSLSLFTGDSVLWIYPDLSTALRSEYEQRPVNIHRLSLLQGKVRGGDDVVCQRGETDGGVGQGDAQRHLQTEPVQGGLHLRPLHGHRAEPDPATEGPVRGASPGSERVLSAGGGEGGVH